MNPQISEDISANFKKFITYVNIIKLIDEKSEIIRDSELTDFIYALKDNFEEIERIINRINYVNYSIKNNIESLMLLISYIDPNILFHKSNPINLIISNIELTNEQLNDIRIKILKELYRLIDIKNNPEMLLYDVKKPMHKKYDLFISYYRWSGKDFASFIKEALNSEGIDAFLDIYDIPKTIKTFSNGWREFIDDSIFNSKIYLLIMTKGFEKRVELLREFQIAKNNNIEILLFKHESLPYQISLEIADEVIDLSNYQVNNFSTQEDLFRKLLDIIT